MRRLIPLAVALAACGGVESASLRVDLRTDLVPVLELEEISVGLDGV